jgi:hypothetical protein
MAVASLTRRSPHPARAAPVVQLDVQVVHRILGGPDQSVQRVRLRAASPLHPLPDGDKVGKVRLQRVAERLGLLGGELEHPTLIVARASER